MRSKDAFPRNGDLYFAWIFLCSPFDLVIMSLMISSIE